jgi:hypothetical protein
MASLPMNVPSRPLLAPRVASSNLENSLPDFSLGANVPNLSDSGVRVARISEHQSYPEPRSIFMSGPALHSVVLRYQPLPTGQENINPEGISSDVDSVSRLYPRTPFRDLTNINKK